MVEGRLILEPEVQEIFKHIDNGQNFLLSGGAGSGKTYSLVQVIKQVIEENPTSKVACMTYTNAAVKEIEERVNHNNLNVSTIHDFLWDNIKHFQKELKATIIALANDEAITRIKIDDLEIVPDDYFNNLENKIQYKEYVRIREGIISHDELLLVAEYMFEHYSKLSDIIKDKYRFIFIDEYQDTNKAVIESFLTHFAQSRKRSIIGFFGDAMQSIYDDGIGNLATYKGEEDGKVKEVKKEQNRRNPQRVIDLANKLRTDGINQIPSVDESAPNMFNGEVKEGNVLFLYSDNDSVENIKVYLTENEGWDFNNSKDTKELNLTHNLIADKAGFRTLMDVYDKDPVISLKNDILAKIKYNKKNNRPKIEILETDSFETVVDKFQLKNRSRELKKDVLTSDPINVTYFNMLKDRAFSDVKKIYLDKDSLLDDKKQDEDDDNKKGSRRDDLIKHLYKVQRNIHLYQNKQYNEFLRVTDYRTKVKSIEDKRNLRNNIEELVDVGDKTIETVINEANEKGICLIDERLERFANEKQYVYDRVKSVPFSEFQKLYDYLEGKTPFSTQHKTKGTEFNNVLMILDNGGWRNYNFENLFIGGGSESVLERSQKIFYVCCTRAKENLAVFYYNPSEVVIEKAIEWFGNERVIRI
ncbi:UvrD-helicase domain-containing protein [Saccharicrinis sp. FJH2]|uniref:UvrD-helicase domain-containing protein n=1 Tax=Saccharicrinis sp. FJH65 TaxID=3344659 RepID=UPI0035F3C8D4